MATLVCCGVVRTLKWPEVTDDRVGDHDDEGQHPCNSNHTVGMGLGLPRPRLQRLADGTVALKGYGN